MPGSPLGVAAFSRESSTSSDFYVAALNDSTTDTAVASIQVGTYDLDAVSHETPCGSLRVADRVVTGDILLRWNNKGLGNWIAPFYSNSDRSESAWLFAFTAKEDQSIWWTQVARDGSTAKTTPMRFEREKELLRWLAFVTPTDVDDDGDTDFLALERVRTSDDRLTHQGELRREAHVVVYQNVSCLDEPSEQCWRVTPIPGLDDVIGLGVAWHRDPGRKDTKKAFQFAAIYYAKKPGEDAGTGMKDAEIRTAYVEFEGGDRDLRLKKMTELVPVAKVSLKILPEGDLTLPREDLVFGDFNGDSILDIAMTSAQGTFAYYRPRLQ